MPQTEVTVQQMPAEALTDALREQKVVALVTSPSVPGWDGPDLPGHRRVGALALTDGPGGGISFWFMRALPPEGPHSGPLAWEEIDGAARKVFEFIQRPDFTPARVWRVPAGRRGT